MNEKMLLNTISLSKKKKIKKFSYQFFFFIQILSFSPIYVIFTQITQIYSITKYKPKLPTIGSWGFKSSIFGMAEGYANHC